MSRAVQRIAVLTVLLQAAQVLGQSQYTWRNVQMFGGGFIPGIVFSQTEPNLIYTRTDIGGAYRFDPATSRWVPLLDSISWDDWNLTGVISIATDPVNPNNVYVAAGTYTNSWTSQNGAILRSSDRGATWSAVPGQPAGFMPHKGVLDTVNGFLYVAYSDKGGPYDGGHGDVWKLNTTWSRIWDWARYPNRTFRYTQDVTACE